MIRRLMISTFLILAMYSLGWMASLVQWNQRRPTAPALQRTHNCRVGLTTTPERASFQTGDRVDILAGHAEDWKIIALDAVVIGASPVSIWIGVKSENEWLVQQDLHNRETWKVQRTISLELPSSEDEHPITANRK